ncbi:MAG: acyltransferase [Pseudomonadota bacterium]
MTHRFAVLDGARGLAALAVLAFHLKLWFGNPGWLQGSFLAVDFFFLLSGVVVAKAYEARIVDGTLGFWRFVRVRAIRLFPLYLIASSIGIAYVVAKIAMGHDDHPTVAAIVAALPATALLLPWLGNEQGMFPFAPSAWSLSMEFWFNLVWALLLCHLRTWMLGVIAGASFALLCVAARHYGTLDLGWNEETLPGGVARFWFSFTLGVIIWRCLGGLALARVPALWPGPVPAAIAAAIAAAFVAIPSGATGLQLLWVCVVFPVFVTLGLRMALPRALLPVADHLGRLSYAIYIIHVPVILFALGAAKLAVDGPLDGDETIAGLFAVLCVLVAAALLTYGVDEPLRRVLSRRHAGPSGAYASPSRAAGT